MAQVSRGTKSSAGGGTEFVTGTNILASEMNTDINALVTGVNSIDDTNVSDSGDIALTKLADISSSASTHDDTTTPGDSSSHTLPTTLSGELQQLRYVEERLALGIGATRVDGTGTGTTFWGDLPARGPNLIINPHFAVAGSAPVDAVDGWTSAGTGTPTFSRVLLAGAHRIEGGGYELRIQAGSAAVARAYQDITLKASTRYLLLARARSTTSAAHLIVTNPDATSSFRAFDLSTSSSSYTTLKGVFQTDSTPTSIRVTLGTNGANGDDVKFAFVGLYECSADMVEFGGSCSYFLSDIGATTLGSAGFTSILGSITVSPPAGGYEVHVDAMVPLANTNAAVHTAAVQLTESGTGLPGAVWEETMPASSTATAQIHYVLPTFQTLVGTPRVFAISGRSTVAANLTTNGTSLVTGTPVRTAYLWVRLVKVSG